MDLYKEVQVECQVQRVTAAEAPVKTAPMCQAICTPVATPSNALVDIMRAITIAQDAACTGTAAVVQDLKQTAERQMQSSGEIKESASRRRRRKDGTYADEEIGPQVDIEGGLWHLGEQQSPKRSFEECWERARDPKRHMFIDSDTKKVKRAYNPRPMRGVYNV